MVALIRSPYFDPWTRRLFGEGELEGSLHPKLRVNPSTHIGGVAGGVIMSKLGNETAKYAWESSSLVALHLFSLKGSTRPCYMEAAVSFILSTRDGVSKGLLRHTMTLRYPEVCTPFSLWNWPKTKIKASNGRRTRGTELILPPKCKTIPMRWMCLWIPSTATEISTPGKLRIYFVWQYFTYWTLNRPHPGEPLHSGNCFD